MSAAESTAHTLTDKISDLVEGARDKIEELPPIARTRHQQSSKKWMILAVVGVLGVLMLIAKRFRGKSVDGADTAESTESVGAKLAEKTLAAS